LLKKAKIYILLIAGFKNKLSFNIEKSLFLSKKPFKAKSRNIFIFIKHVKEKLSIANYQIDNHFKREVKRSLG
jgi:hypothetical protein